MANYEQQKNFSVANKVKYSSGATEKFVISHGASILWERAYLCTCVAESGVPDPACPICGGLGYAFTDGITTQVMLQESTTAVKQSLYGMNTTGTSLATSLNEDLIGIRDRITFSDRKAPVSIIIPITKETVLHGKRLRYDVQKIDLAFMSSGKGKQDTVDPKDLEIDFKEDMFYPTEDMIGKTLSLNMHVSLRWYVIDVLKDARYQYENDARLSASNREMTELPRLLLLRREDQFIPAVYNESNDGKFNPEYVSDETGSDTSVHDSLFNAYLN